MQTAGEADHSTDFNAWPAAPLTRALELLAEGCGVQLEPSQAWRAAADGIAQGRGDALRSLALAARRVRLLVTSASELGPLRELAGRALTWTPRPGGGCWVLVLGRRASKLELVLLDEDGERRRWMSAAELQAWLELELGGAPEQRWWRAEPLLPLASLSGGQPATKKLGPVGRLLALAKLEREELGVVLIYALAVGGLTLSVPVAVQALVNTVAFGSVLQPLVVASLLLALALGFVAALRVLQALIVEAIQQRLFVRAAADFARRFPRLADEARGSYHAPELANRLFDVVTLQKAGASLLIDGLALLLQMIVGMALLAFYHPLLLAFDLLLVLGVLAVVFVAGRGAVATAVTESSRKYAVAAWIEQLAASPTRLTNARARAFADARAELLIHEWLRARQRHFGRLLRQLGGGLGLQALASTALLGLGGWLVIERQLTLGQLVAAELVVTAIGVGLGKLGKHLETFYDASAAAAKLGKVVDQPLERSGGELPTRGGALEVLVRERGDASSLLALASGEKLGLLGRTPAHSSLCDALFGRAAEPELEVLLDGCPLRSLDLEAVRGQLALVRDVELFAGSLRDNLDPRPIPSDGASLREVLELVGLRERVAELPEQLNTPLLPSGAPLCEAEARRLILAAALLRRPRLLLIDGGLDGLGLDPETRARLLAHLFASDAPWTLLLITDDPELLSQCR
jgi:putative ABC transport system ATP-binding protein